MPRSALNDPAIAHVPGPNAWEMFRDNAIRHDQELEGLSHGWRRVRLVRRWRLRRWSRNCWAASRELGKHHFG